jgi:mono/diheme cytochrome c family protein
MIRRRGILAGLMVAALMASSCRRETQRPASGAVLYRQYCASCHGVDGRGDGPAAAALSPPPTDLTRLTLGVPELMTAIDGRRSLRAHGTAAMPVWGEVFEQSLIDERHRRRTALMKTQALADYVKGLQS